MNFYQTQKILWTKSTENKNSEDLTETKKVLERAKELSEINPMMGHRGVRIGITYPEIYRNADYCSF